MCQIKHLSCGVCHAEGKYAFYKCDDFHREHLTAGNENFSPTLCRFYCDDFKWPIEDADLVYGVCESCFERGRQFYQSYEKMQKLQAVHTHHHHNYGGIYVDPVSEQQNGQHQADAAGPLLGKPAKKGRPTRSKSAAKSHPAANAKPAGRSVTIHLKLGKDASTANELVSGNGNAHLFENQKRSYLASAPNSLPPEFQDLRDGIKINMVERYRRLSSRADPHDINALLRLHDADDRELIVLMPFCSICKKPTKREFDDDEVGIADIELDMNRALKKWLVRLRNEEFIQVTVKTGFIHKACQTCIRDELTLRAKVTKFLMNCESEGSYWAIYIWLLGRGTRYPVHSHECHNLGFPARRPMPLEDMLRFMAVSWEQLNGGIAWEDTVELHPPTTCPLVTFLHKEPLLQLDQWHNRAGMWNTRDPVVFREPPMPPVDEAVPVPGGGVVENTPMKLRITRHKNAKGGTKKQNQKGGNNKQKKAILHVGGVILEDGKWRRQKRMRLRSGQGEAGGTKQPGDQEEGDIVMTNAATLDNESGLEQPDTPGEPEEEQEEEHDVQIIKIGGKLEGRVDIMGDEALFVPCNQGCVHLVDVRRTAPGEVFSIPL